MLNIKRLDEIFQTIQSVPIIGGMYIGMNEEDAAERQEELISYKEEHSYDYPNDLIFNYKITFEYNLFEYESLVKSISVVFPREFTKKDFEMVKDYLSLKYYHEEIHEDTITDRESNIISGSVTLENAFYQYSILNEDGTFIVKVSATTDNCTLYKSLYLMATSAPLFDFVNRSLFFSNNESIGDDYLNNILKVYNGFPSFCNMYLGFGESSSSDAENIIYENLHSIDMRDYLFNYRDISYEVIMSWDGYVEQIYLRMSEDNLENMLAMMQYIKKRFLIESASYDIQHDSNGELTKLDVEINNEFISVKLKRNYYIHSNRYGLELIIEAVEKDNGQLYQALYNMLVEDSHFSYFKTAKSFYKDRNDTQDAKFNGLRVKYKTFEDALDDYIEPKMSYARDMGGYSDKEYERDRDHILEIWNKPGGDDSLPMSWVNVTPTIK